MGPSKNTPADFSMQQFRKNLHRWNYLSTMQIEQAERERRPEVVGKLFHLKVLLNKVSMLAEENI
ncbi:MAG TPA: hypothetical protein VGK99_03980 [Acidobacteriota bacterium]|jgi:hypothetical protein